VGLRGKGHTGHPPIGQLNPRVTHLTEHGHSQGMEEEGVTSLSILQFLRAQTTEQAQSCEGGEEKANQHNTEHAQFWVRSLVLGGKVKHAQSQGKGK
jgi:hypothetical protein